MADSFARPLKRGANIALAVAQIWSAVKIQVIPREYLSTTSSITNRVWRHKKLIPRQSPWPHFRTKGQSFGPEKYSKGIDLWYIFATRYTATRNLQGPYRTAVTKNESIHLHFKIYKTTAAGRKYYTNLQGGKTQCEDIRSAIIH